MRSFKVSKQSNLPTEEKIKLIDTYDVDDLHNVLREFEENPKEYDKAIIIEVINKLFEKGITSI